LADVISPNSPRVSGITKVKQELTLNRKILSSLNDIVVVEFLDDAEVEFLDDEGVEFLHDAEVEFLDNGLEGHGGELESHDDGVEDLDAWR
jgi:hypothetical protein